MRIETSEVFQKNWEAYHSEKRFILNQGGSRSSKTFSILQLIIVLCLQKSGLRISIVRETLPALKSTAMRDFFEILRSLDLYSEKRHNKTDNLYFFEAINYPLFVKLMQSASFIVTDSGGIQEEAPYLSKPVLIFRNETERTEGIDYGMARLVGTEEHLIHGAILELLTDDKSYNSMIKTGLQPYGDGLAAERIAEICLLFLREKGLN